MMRLIFCIAIAVGSVGVACGELSLGKLESAAGKRRSLIDSDPNVIYVRELISDEQGVELAIVAPGRVYSTKTGGRSLGTLSKGKVKLIGFDDRACKVQGQGKIGWVKPSILKAKKGNLQELLKTVYEREIEVRRLIAAGEVALGMSRAEVMRVLGEPTKQSLRRTAEGVGGTMEFIEYEEVKHFDSVVDRFTGSVFRRFSHSTQEEKSKTIVEFEDDVVSAIEESESESGGEVKIVRRPIIWVR